MMVAWQGMAGSAAAKHNTAAACSRLSRLQAATICDMIKGNESDVRNIDFELQAKIGDKFLCSTLFFN